MSRLLRGGLIVALLAAFVVGVARAAAPPDDEPLPNGWFYRQTGQESGNGFAVTDEGGIPFWTEFRKFSLQEIGYPISHRFTYKGFITQAFQKAVLQWDASNKAFNFLNILDEMNIAGMDGAMNTVRQVPPHAALAEDAAFDPATPAGFEQIKKNHLAILNGIDPEFATWFDAARHPRWLELYGLPISYGVTGPVQVLRAQRQVFQVWTEDGGGGPKGKAVLANTGDYMKEFKVISGEPVTPMSIEQVKGQPTATATPVATASPILAAAAAARPPRISACMP